MLQSADSGIYTENKVAVSKPKSSAAKKASKGAAVKLGEEGRTRSSRPYPASSFEDALDLGAAIMRLAAGERVRRLTLLEKMGKSATIYRPIQAAL